MQNYNTKIQNISSLYSWAFRYSSK